MNMNNAHCITKKNAATQFEYEASENIKPYRVAHNDVMQEFHKAKKVGKVTKELLGRMEAAKAVYDAQSVIFQAHMFVANKVRNGSVPVSALPVIRVYEKKPCPYGIPF